MPVGLAIAIVPSYARVPALVMPLEGDSEFALFRTRRDFTLLDARKVSLAEALLRSLAA